MGKRKLASIQYVHNITPIEGAEKIECVHVLGWQCVANKGQFGIGDKCVYMEVDSFLPVCERFEFLRASSFKENEIMGAGFRLKTMKFRGQISQGLVQPLEILPEGKYEIGDDVTELLGIRKWEIEERVSNDGTVIAEFPSEISKTDELRVQSYPELIEEFKSVKGYYISTKMDGCSVTMYKSGDHFGVCGRNYEYADDDKCDMWKYAHEHRIEERLKENNLDDIAIQGEFCGPGIQKNRLNLKTPEWYVFTITDMKTNTRFSMYKTEEICKLLGLNMVPVEEVEEEFKYKSVDELLERAKGKYTSGKNKEGIVIRPVETVYSNTIAGPLSMKVINNDYLLKE
ncbi:putative RNA ligase [Lachnoanaerobaculum sp. MSX33]|uniref:RNA ligase family protein n=1 Tax=Lachnoanaerobaculum sp. MSX33 TaxID=936596 RepID=UPI0003DFA053|nr:RNA ligase family protein [Lachnoanaerobaculum sp. MSX33]ETO98824.1 putative RNA ligase [Lachnoanaerobaculum sp. MSX33]